MQSTTGSGRLAKTRARAFLSGSQQRSGASVVEVAMVAPLTFLLIIGLIVGGLGTFRYQQVASLARAGARWAALRGPQFSKRNNLPLPTADDVMASAILPRAVSLNRQRLTCELKRDADNSTVTITLRYLWIPESYLKPVTFASTAVLPISN